MCFNQRRRRLLPRGVQTKRGRICLPCRLARVRAVIFERLYNCELSVAYRFRTYQISVFQNTFHSTFFYGEIDFRHVIDSQVFFRSPGLFEITSAFFIRRPTVCSSVLVSTLRDIID